MVGIHLAADGLSLEQACHYLELFGDELESVKIHDLLDSLGPRCIAALKTAGARRLWVDYKLLDTPGTVGKRAKALVSNGADILTVHGGDIDIMRATVESGAETYAVTALTSLAPSEVELLYGHGPQAVVLYRARMAKLAGVHGIVASAQEVDMLVGRPELKGMKIVIPGTRSPGVALGDQKRSDTPEAAVRAGATDLVVGSEVTTAENPLEAFHTFSRGAHAGLEPPEA